MATLTAAQFIQYTDLLANQFTALLGDGKNYGSGDSNQSLTTSANLAGTVAANQFDTLITGSGTSFTTNFNVNDWIRYSASTNTLNGGITLPTPTITLNSASSFPSAGYMNIGNTSVSYTSKTSTQLQGCVGGVGTFASGTAVYGQLYNHRIQMISGNGMMIVFPPISVSNFSGYSYQKASDWGWSYQARTTENTVITSFTDYSLLSSLISSVHDPQNFAAYQAITGVGLKQAILGLKRVCQIAGAAILGSNISDIDSFATYYNTGPGGPFNALVAPDFANMYSTFYGKSMTAANVVPPTTSNFGSFNFATSVFTPGTIVDGSRYAGAPILTITISGYSGSASSGVLYVPVTGLNAAGKVVTDNFSSVVTGNGTYTLAGSTVQVVRSISQSGWVVPGFLTSGTGSTNHVKQNGRMYNLQPQQ